MGRRTDLSVIAPPKGLTASRMSGSGPKIFNFPGTKRPLSCVRGAWGVGLWLRVERQRIAITRKGA
jgi:hypothetical protein